MALEEYTLDNGLRVVVERRRASTVGIAAAVAAGSYSDPRGLEGLAHLVEHMLFQTNERYTAEEIDSEVELAGGSANAVTTREYVVVHMEAVPGSLPKLADILESMISSRLVVEEELEREKRVLASEIEGYRADDRAWIARLAAQAALGPEAGRPIEGYSEAVARATPADVERFKERNYNASNTVVAIAGSFTGEELRLALQALSRIPEGRPAPRPRPEPRPGDVAEERGAPTAQVAVSYLLPGHRELGDLVWDAKLLAFNMAVGATSALHEVVRRRRALAYAYDAIQEYNENATLIAFIVEDVDKSRVDEALEALEHEAWRVLDEKLGDTGYVEGRRRLLRYLNRPEALTMDEEAMILAVRRLAGQQPLTYEERIEKLLNRPWSTSRVAEKIEARTTAIIT